jgi:hypothetical protein
MHIGGAILKNDAITPRISKNDAITPLHIKNDALTPRHISVRSKNIKNIALLDNTLIFDATSMARY